LRVSRCWLRVAGYRFCSVTGFFCHFEGAFIATEKSLLEWEIVGSQKGQEEVLKMTFYGDNASEVLRVASCEFRVAGFILLQVAGFVLLQVSFCHFEGAFIATEKSLLEWENHQLPNGQEEVSKMVF